MIAIASEGAERVVGSRPEGRGVYRKTHHPPPRFSPIPPSCTARRIHFRKEKDEKPLLIYMVARGILDAAAPIALYFFSLFRQHRIAAR